MDALADCLTVPVGKSKGLYKYAASASTCWLITAVPEWAVTEIYPHQITGEMMSAEHTATPWEVIDNGSNESFDIDALDSHGRWVTLATANQADAKFIVRACNSHAALIKALEDILEQPKETLSDGKALTAIVRIAKAALAKASS